jgi:hypothetical protein
MFSTLSTRFGISVIALVFAKFGGAPPAARALRAAAGVA